jgi:hypothetical protein
MAEMDEVMICYGGAGPTDTHLLADVVAIDGEIVRLIERRERRKKDRAKDAAVVDR